MTNFTPLPPLTPDEEQAAKMSSLDWKRIQAKGAVIKTEYADHAWKIVNDFLDYHKIDRDGLSTIPVFENGNYNTKKIGSIAISELAISAIRAKGLDLVDMADRSPSKSGKSFTR